MDGAARDAWNQARPGRAAHHRSVCIAPSVSLEFDPSGWVYACCANQLYPLGRIGTDRLSELWDGPRAQVLRSALDEWDLSVGCGACRWHLEHSRTDPDAAVYDRYAIQGDPPAGPASMTFALSNRCNLGCVMCTPELSSTLRHQAGLAPLASPYDDAFYDELAPFLPGLEYAKFLGGEPFLIPEHHRVWDLMDEVGGPPKMQVTTNGTIWNERVSWLLQRFRFDVTISIDAASADRYEQIRRGGRFEVVERNIARFADACRDAGTELRFCFCLMVENSAELAPMVRWADRLGAALSVNVVSDLGHALHDEPVEALEVVRRSWAEEACEPFGANAAVWDLQVAQLDAVIAERRAGIPAATRQPRSADATLLAPDFVDPQRSGLTDHPDLDQQRGRLSAWAGGGSVGEVEVGPDQVVRSVSHGHARLGLDERLVGQAAGTIIDAVTTADGRPAWVVGIDAPPSGVLVRSIVLSADRPQRGAAGSVVRIVLVPTATGFTVLLAEDRIYDGALTASPPALPVGAGVPVAMPGRSSDDV